MDASENPVELDREKVIDFLESQFPALFEAAVRIARFNTLAAGHSVLESENGFIYETFPDGSRKVVKQIAPPLLLISARGSPFNDSGCLQSSHDCGAKRLGESTIKADIRSDLFETYINPDLIEAELKHDGGLDLQSGEFGVALLPSASTNKYRFDLHINFH